MSRAAIRPDLSILTMAEILEAKPRVGYYLNNEPDRTELGEVMETKLSEIQSRPVVIQEDSSVYNAVVTLFLEDIGTLFVNDEDGYLVGIVSRKDLLKITIGESDIQKLPVSVVMTRMPNIVVTKDDETFYTAAQKIVEYKVDALPVVVEEEFEGKTRYKVTGRFSKTNLATTLVSHFSEM